MKKLVSVLFALLLVGSFAFADVAIGGWGRFIYSPMASIDGGETFSFSAPSWANGGRVGFNVTGTSDNAGFKLNVDSNGNGLGVGDNAKIWIKFNDMLTIQGGKVQGDVLRGKIDDSGTLNAISIAQGTTGKDAVFQRFYPKLGLLLDVTPAEGVYLGVALDTTTAKITNDEIADLIAAGMPLSEVASLLETAIGGNGDEDNPWVLAEPTEFTFKKIQLGAGYVIADVGHFRAQYVGNVDDAEKYINAAFAYTGMEGLVVDAGVKIQLDGDKSGKQSTFVVHSTYNKDALAALARVNVGFGDDGASDVLALGGSVDLAYTVADPLAVGFEASYQKRDDPYALSILPYGKMGYGNGYAKAGFLYTITDNGTDSIGAWALPIVLEYWF